MYVIQNIRCTPCELNWTSTTVVQWYCQQHSVHSSQPSVVLWQTHALPLTLTLTWMDCVHAIYEQRNDYIDYNGSISSSFDSLVVFRLFISVFLSRLLSARAPTTDTFRSAGIQCSGRSGRSEMTNDIHCWHINNTLWQLAWPRLHLFEWCSVCVRAVIHNIVLASVMVTITNHDNYRRSFQFVTSSNRIFPFHWRKPYFSSKKLSEFRLENDQIRLQTRIDSLNWAVDIHSLQTKSKFL